MGVISWCVFSSFASAAIDPATRLQAQAQIEDEIGKSLKSQLAPEEYLLVVDLDLEEVAREPKATNDQTKSNGQLPYLTLKVDPDRLNGTNQISGLNAPPHKIKGMRVELTFDERIPEEKRKILEKSLRRKLAINDADRTLQVSSAPLVTESITEQLRKARDDGNKNPGTGKSSAQEGEKSNEERIKFELETERIKLEVAKKDLEIQRNRLEQTRALADIESKMRILEGQLKAAEQEASLERKRAQKPESSPDSGKSSASKIPEEIGPLATLSRIQGMIVGGLLALVLLLGLLITSGAFKKGMTALSDGFSKIGSGFKEAALATAEAQKERSRNQKSENQDLGSSKEDEKSASQETENHSSVSTIKKPPEALNESERQKFEEFILYVQDKIEILAKERSFALYRETQDFVDNDQSLPMAAALFLSLSREATIELVKGLSTSHIERLKRFLGRPGAIQECKALRNAAIQEFYGRIVVEEFAGSPIMQIKDSDWLLRLSNEELAKTTLALPVTLRSVFLACFSPIRVKKMVEASADSSSKKALVEAAVNLGESSQDSIPRLLEELAKIRTSMQQPKEPSSGVDRARYLSRLAENLNNEDQKLLLTEINRKDDVQKDFSKYYVAFNVIRNLPKEIILEIFGERTDNQIAIMIFASEDETREAVLKALPEIRSATVRDELKLLDSKPFYKKRNEKQSLALQRQISNYLIRLKDEGLLDQVTSDKKSIDGAA
jgi:hypothetical protein